MNGRLNGLEDPPSTSPDDNQSIRNDCSKKCVNDSNNRTNVNHFNNISNHGEDQAKVNNNAGSSRMCFSFQNGASTSRSCMEVGELKQWNIVDLQSTAPTKCITKVRNGSIDSGTSRKARKLRSSDDSSSENEGDEDFCVYKYKDSMQADLPRSFYTLDRLAQGIDKPEDDQEIDPLPLENARSIAGSSPDNDFLEMDFDPGPSLDLDLDGSEHEQDGRVSPVPELPSEENDLSAENQNVECAEYVNNVLEPDRIGEYHHVRYSPLLTSAIPTSTHRQSFPRDSWGHHSSSGDLCSPWDATEMESGGTLELWKSNNLKVDGEDTRKYNLFSDLYHSIMAKRLVMEKNASIAEVSKGDSNDMSPEEPDSTPVDRTMIWSEQEACSKQVTQISTSACGATAVINVMMALNTPFSLEKLKKGVGTRLRQESAPLVQYLISRSNAGATHEDIMRGIEAASEGWLFARFFHMFPERKFSLSKWLSYWMRKGAVPIATLNLQASLAPSAAVPDAWHHQMIFGVSPRGVFLTNPLECVPEEVLLGQLCSPSVLKVKRRDVLQRWTTSTDLTPLMCLTDVRWKKLNVLGQVVSTIRESLSCDSLTEHVTIPAAYKSGITLVIPRDSPGFEELSSHPELPIMPIPNYSLYHINSNPC